MNRQLSDLYRGQIAEPFRVLTELLQGVHRPHYRLLEIGCASGYYYEVLEYLLKVRLDYTGVDISPSMINLARSLYPNADFRVSRGNCLPFSDREFDTVISGFVLLHVVDYAENIAETCRVCDSRIVVHRTPICRIRAT